MNNYFVRRLLLIIPTFLGITVIVFAITRFVPGGPIEQAIMRAMLSSGSEKSGGAADNNISTATPLSDETLAEIKAYYGFDKPWPIAYVDWLGKILRGDFGRSSKYSDPVLGMIVSRFPVSLRFGLISLILTYMICIPLGIKKALTHRKAFDNISSGLIFIGYALPGYIVAILLLTIFAFRLNWLPTGELVSRNYAQLSPMGKMWDVISHMILPIVAYTAGNYATLTMVMKNNLMENMAADYIKTAVAKGCAFKSAMWKHAFRNSIIPIAAGLGGIIGIFFAGSFLIERIFNIRGMGLLGFSAIEERDYPVVLGIVAITAMLTLTGNILSDLILSITDPRIKLGR